MKNVLDEMKGGRRSVSHCLSTAAELLELLGPLKVIEIGTAYGVELHHMAPLSKMTVCVDAMYDWVPDVNEDCLHDPSLIDQVKVNSWMSNTESFRDKVTLVIGSSFQAHAEEKNEKIFADTDILIIDGCHSPAEQVLKDYTNFERFMKDEHYVVWDDTHMGAVASAIVMARRHIQEKKWTVEERRVEDATVFWVKKNAP